MDRLRFTAHRRAGKDRRMKLRTPSRLALLALLPAAVSAAGTPDIGELTRELAGGSPAAGRTPEALETAYGQALDALLADLSDQDPGKRGAAQATIERIAFHASRPGAETERAGCS